ncbi:hypothetical protein ACSMXN_10275 [Jatrophihabitans sp. DSM 45814]
MIGLVGTLTLPCRGEDGPGEVQVSIRGGTERFIALSETPLAVGTRVLVIDTHPHRTVTVVRWEGMD